MTDNIPLISFAEYQNGMQGDMKLGHVPLTVTSQAREFAARHIGCKGIDRHQAKMQSVGQVGKLCKPVFLMLVKHVPT